MFIPTCKICSRVNRVSSPTNVPQGYVKHMYTTLRGLSLQSLHWVGVRTLSTFSWSSTAAVGWKSNSASALWTGIASSMNCVQPSWDWITLRQADHVHRIDRSARIRLLAYSLYGIHWLHAVSVLFRVYTPAFKPPILTQ